MSKLQEIREEVSQEFGYIDYGDLLESISYDEPEAASALDEIDRRYATAVAEDALKRAAERASILFKKDGITATYFQIDRESIEVDKQSILSTEINLDL